MNKKILITALALTLTFCSTALVAPLNDIGSFNLSASAQSAHSIQYGDYLCQILDDDTIEILRYLGSETDLVVPSEIEGKVVTEIGHYAGDGEDGYYCGIALGAFEDNKKLKSVTIPKTVTKITDYAFGTEIIINEKGSLDEVPNTDVKIFCYKGSEAEKYAIKYNFDYSVIDAPEHECKYEEKLVRPSTCHHEGEKKFTCPVCGKSYRESIAKKTTHVYETTKVAATYTHRGYTLHTCKICRKSYKDNYTSVLKLGKVSGVKKTTGKNAVKLTWSKVTDASGYIVYRYNINTKKWVKLGKVTKNSYYDKKLLSGKTYKYAIKAYIKESGKEVVSAKSTHVTTSTKPAAPKLKLTAGKNKVTLKWNKVSGSAVGYKLYYKTNKNSAWKLFRKTNSKTTSFTKTGLDSGKTYYFAVQACKTQNGVKYSSGLSTGKISTNA